MRTHTRTVGGTVRASSPARASHVRHPARLGGIVTIPQLIMLALKTMLTVFGFGLQAILSDLGYLARRPWLLIRSVVSMLVIMPAAALAMIAIFPMRPSVEIAIMALAISPVPSNQLLGRRPFSGHDQWAADRRHVGLALHGDGVGRRAGQRCPSECRGAV